MNISFISELTSPFVARSSTPSLSPLVRRIFLDYHDSSNIVLQSGHREAIETMKSNAAELRDLLIQVLTVKSETQQIVEMQKAGEHVAERFMEAGQRVSYQ